MDGRIFLLDDNQSLVSMTQKPYDSEELLQHLLAEHPDLLASDQIGGEPRRWLLLSREAPIPDQDDQLNGRWSLDHLFLDQDGIPTLVEVKRSSDTRIRREVVGQMLDYAANAVAYWKTEELRASFEAVLGAVEPAEVLADRLGVTSVNDFWQMVETNLRAGRLRLIFVADDIPYELRRIVEFLNEQMSPTEVLAVAIRQYTGQGLKTLVPTLYGQTAKAAGAKSSGENQKWSESTFFPKLASYRNQHEAEAAHRILDWARRRELRIWWGEGKRIGSFFPMLDTPDDRHFSISVWTNGYIEVQFQHMRPPFDTEAMRREFLSRLNSIAGVDLPHDRLSRRPSFRIEALLPEGHLEQFIKTLDWFIETVLASDSI